MSDEPNTLPAVTPKSRPISRRVKRAIRMMIDGKAKTITAAAELADLSREALSRALSRPNVVKYLHEKTLRSLGIAAARAGAVKIELLESRNARVRSEVATYLLAIAGIKPAADPQVSISIEAKAGWVVDLRDEPKTGDPPAPAPKIIEHEPATAAPRSSEIKSEIDDAK